MTTRLTVETRGVLERSAITETTVTLPEQLPRELYMRVNAVLTNAGGRWNRKAMCHVFDRDPRGILGLALATGVSVDEKQLNQEFFTPPELALRLVETVGVSGMKVLEPSAGEGALADAALRRGASEVVCYERQMRLARKLKEKGHLFMCADFLTVPVPPNDVAMFDRVVMNPPFTKGQDVRHIRHAQQFLRPGGLLGAICGDGPAQARGLMDESVDWIRLPEGSFKSAGTGVRTAIVVMGSAR